MGSAGKSFVEETLDALLSETQSAEPDLSALYAKLDREAALGSADSLLQLHDALASLPVEAPEWSRAAMRERLEAGLALIPRPENLAACLTLARSHPPDSPQTRRFAAQLAQGQLPSELLHLFLERHDDDALRELLACVLHELVARGMECTGEAGPEALQRRLREVGHPLGWLSLTRAEVERDLPIRRFFPEGQSAALLERGGPPGAEVRADQSVSPQPIDDAELEGRLRAAVEGWERDSNGSIETALLFFEGRPPTAKMIGPRFLGSLGLACSENEQPGIWPVEPERVIASLFQAASSGGAHGGAMEHAYGRLLAWISLGALCGARAEQPFGEVLELVEGSPLFEFETRSRWFSQVAWDLAFLALVPRRSRAHVLAATDTD